MRCNNCGWDNPDGLTRCEKCGSPLENRNSYQSAPAGNAAMGAAAGTVAEGAAAPQPALNKTVRESSVFNDSPGAKPSSQPSVCPSCGYQLRSNVSVCPNCQQPIGGGGKTVAERQPEAKPAKSFGGTVMPGCNCVTEIGFTLTPVAHEGESRIPAKVDFEESRVELNRSNLEPANRTITSKVQAVMVFNERSRCWSIQDKSDQKYTFVQCRNEMCLKDGDILLMGDRKFEFHPIGGKSSSEGQSPVGGTIVMGRQQSNIPTCRLVALPYPGESEAPDECVLRGESNEVNRKLLDAENYTITSRVQALLTYENGEWYVKDQSTLKTTYLLCAEPVCLKDGDTILMGNRSFTFNV